MQFNQIKEGKENIHLNLSKLLESQLHHLRKSSNQNHFINKIETETKMIVFCKKV